jgi:hypothetical protein
MLRKDPFITGEYYHLYNRGIDKRNGVARTVLATGERA